jgi:DNA-directed RNA polymerase subunit RPC12/RpoP
MEEWHCFRCKVPMEETDITMIYMDDMEMPGAFGVRCPNCGTEYLMEEFVIDEVAKGEKVLEGK